MAGTLTHIAESMQILSEFRYPTRWYSKLVAAILAISFFTLLAAGIISGFVVYSMMTPPGNTSQAIDLASFPGHPEEVSYMLDGVGSRTGWFFPGLKSAPTILLCPGYQDTHGELLPLATALQNQQYNVFLFDFVGGAGGGHSTLGYREVQELRAAVSALAERSDVDRSRFGLWGTNMGAYAAMALAESDPRIRALAVESVYDKPEDMVRLQVEQYGIASLPLLRSFAVRGFMLLQRENRDTPPLSARLSRLPGVPKLFIEAADAPALADSTRELFELSPEPKQQALIPQGKYAGMLDDQKRNYENRILSFFLLNLQP